MSDGEKITVENSSNIASYAYAPSRSVLTVEFKSGATWEYERVPPHIFDGMKAAASKGSYFFGRVKGYFEGKKI